MVTAADDVIAFNAVVSYRHRLREIGSHEFDVRAAPFYAYLVNIESHVLQAFVGRHLSVVVLSVF
jgi:hypothetical protein